MASMICPKCGAELPDGSLSCEVCGASLQSEYDFCPDCKSPVKKGALFCSECGAKVNEAAAPIGDFSFIDSAKQGTLEPDVPKFSQQDAPPIQASPVSPAPQELPVAPAQKEVPAQTDDAPAPTPAASQPIPPTAPPVSSTGPIPQAPPVNTQSFSRPIQETPRHRTPPQPQTPYPPTGFARNAQPPKGSRYAPISTWGYVGTILLFGVPLIGWIFCLVWACGGCTKINKRNLARAYILIFVLVVLVLAIVGALLYFFAYSWIEPYINMILTLELKPVY